MASLGPPLPTSDPPLPKPKRAWRSHKSFWRRWPAVLATALLAVLAITVLVAWGGTLWLKYAMRASLPTLDGTLHAPGLSAPVTVLRDQHGVPHISAANMDDLVFAQGYVTAQDRLWQMDMLRRFAAGNLAEILGRSALEHDRAQRILQIGSAAQNALSGMSAADRHFLDDYARGVNAYIVQTRNNLPAEFRLLHYQPQPWLPVDSMLCGLDMAESLTMDFPTKLAREKIAAELPPQLLADLYPVGSWRDHPPVSTEPDITAPQKIEQVPLDSTQVSVDDILRLEGLLPRVSGCWECAAGSNNWVVSGAHTVTGMPLLSNDMHLHHTIPDTWYEAQLTSGDFNVAGITLPGIPFVIVGHNAHIAWGFTLIYADVQDLYVEQTRGDEYRTPAGWRPFHHDREVIHVRGGRDVTLDALGTDHGPVITPLLDLGRKTNSEQRIPPEHRTLSLRWTVYDPAALTLPFYEINSALNWEQFRSAFALFGGPPQNVVYGDKAGNIGYQAVGKVPYRPNGLAAMPITDSQHEWQGYIPFEKMPSVYNPPEGILATANSRVTPDNSAYLLTLDWASPYRNERIWRVLASKPKLSASDMLALQNDVRSTVDQELAQRFAYAIDHTTRASKRLRDAANLLRSWDGEVTISSPAATIVDAARAALWPMLLKPKLGNEWKLYTWAESTFVEDELVSNQPARWLPPGTADWNQLLAGAVLKGMDTMQAPANLEDWHYGNLHPVEIKHPLFGEVPWLRNWTGTGVLPQSGDGTTVKQVGRTFGPSERFTVDFSNLDRSTLNIVIGESGDPVSPYYMDHWKYWYNGTSFPLPFREASVRAAAAHTLKLLP